MIGNILKKYFGAVSGNPASDNDSTMTVDEDGDKIWRNAQGQWHRLDGPAIEGADGTKSWYVDGKRHRLDGPAYERADGLKLWYIDGKLHRLDGPACEWPSGTKIWWVDGKRHRLDGPAIEGADGTKEWHIDGNELTKAAFNKHPAVLEFQRSRQAELEAAKKQKLDDMHKVLGAVVRDFHRKIGGPQ